MAANYHLLPAVAITLLLDVFLFCVYLQSRYAHRAGKLISLALGMILFFYPVMYEGSWYDASLYQKKALTPLIYFLHKNAFHQPVYFISAYTAYMVSVLEEAGSYYTGRIEFQAWMRGTDRKNMSPTQIKANQFFATALAEDIYTL
jgi:hypothetical protein